MAAYKIFGFEIRKSGEMPALAPVVKNDGAIENEVSAAGASAYGYYLDLNKRLTNEIDLINKYRSMSQVAEIDAAIEDIVNEAIVVEENQPPVSISIRTDDGDIPEQIADAITEEFKNILVLLDFHDNGHELFRQWYVDGKLYAQIVADESDLAAGIQDIRMLDPRKIKKVRDIIRQKNSGGADVVVGTEEYFVFNEQGTQSGGTGIKLSPDTVIYANSGLTDEYNSPISYLHKAIKPANQLRYMEDAALIYTLSRAPSRRVFYIDIADMPKQKADQYMQNIMAKYKNKISYNTADGSIADDRVHTTLLEDYWLPRRCFSLDTKVKLLDGRDVSIGDLSIEYQQGKKNWTYSVSDDGTIVPGLITWAGTTMKNAEVVDVHLDNGEVITCTPDHKFIARNGEKIQAQNLIAGTSLMPIYTEKREMTQTGKDYEYVLDNKTNKWTTVHKMVKSFMEEIPARHVIHHVDFNRFNNNPENLRLMTKQDHLDLHVQSAAIAWANASPEKREAWRNNLSISAKNFYQTEEGINVRNEISERNKTCQAIIDGFAKGRENAAAIRAHDKATMPKEEFFKKYPIDGLDNTFAHAARKHDKETMSDAEYHAKWIEPNSVALKARYDKILSKYDLNEIKKAIEIAFHPLIKNPEIVVAVNTVYPNLTITTLRSLLEKHGYATISDFIARNFDGLAPRRKYRAKNPDAKNHRVVKVVRRIDRVDVGTLTVDGDETLHSYHNYALAAGVFVMNSNGRATEIQTLPSETISGQMDNVNYFLNKLYGALNIPLSRLKQDSGFSLGRTQEITRDEIKFSKFIDRLRKRFTAVFLQALRVQLILKGIITPEDWEFIRSRITFDYLRDNHFTELKETEILSNRLQMAEQVMPLVGTFYSMDYVRRKVLRQTDEEIEEMQQQIQSHGGMPPQNKEE